jgi:putative ABC transport system permease protein
MQVIGVMEAKGGGIQNLDDQAFVPLSTVATRLQPARTASAAEMVSSITVQVTNEDLVDEAIQQVGDLLRRRHRVAQDDFVVSSQRDFLAAIGQITGMFTAFLGAIAGVSLLVGGIGIMNIMLVSVTERTREIGIRMAIGARGGDVLLQFLVESVVMSLMGGVIGLAVGYGGAALLGRMTGWSTSTPPAAVMIAVGFSAAVGVFFGFYPARKAAALNPIEALRYE